MRVLAAAVAVVVLIAAPGFGEINVSVVADNQTLYVGQQTLVHVLAQGSAGGLAGLAGSVVASGDAALTASAFGFVPGFLGWADAPPLAPVVGAAGTNGGWAGFGSMQTALPINPLFAKNALTEIASYTVTAVAPGQVALNFQSGQVSGFLSAECDKTTVMGTLNGALINVLVPEPASLALLGLGGLAWYRRRR